MSHASLKSTVHKAVEAPASAALLRRKCSCEGNGESCARCTPDRPDPGQLPSAVPPIVHDVLASPGRPLDATTRNYMEPRFAMDFSGVRVHTDRQAAESAQSVGAHAFTAGRNLVFGQGQYRPNDKAGKRLIAHELAHVAQQRGESIEGRQLKVDRPDSREERIAEASGDLAASGQFADVKPAGGAHIRRQTVDPRHARGFAGEQTMGFHLYSQEAGWQFIEGPSGAGGHSVVGSGFDGVAYNQKLDLLDLIDNKSLARAGNVSSATAIDPAANLAQNLDTTIARLRAMSDVPNRIRILELLRAKRASLSAGTPGPSQVRLVVTHEGGRTTGVSAALQSRGVQTPNAAQQRANALGATPLAAAPAAAATAPAAPATAPAAPATAPAAPATASVVASDAPPASAPGSEPRVRVADPAPAPGPRVVLDKPLAGAAQDAPPSTRTRVELREPVYVGVIDEEVPASAVPQRQARQASLGRPAPPTSRAPSTTPSQLSPTRPPAPAPQAAPKPAPPSSVAEPAATAPATSAPKPPVPPPTSARPAAPNSATPPEPQPLRGAGGQRVYTGRPVQSQAVEIPGQELRAGDVAQRAGELAVALSFTRANLEDISNADEKSKAVAWLVQNRPQIYQQLFENPGAGMVVTFHFLRKDGNLEFNGATTDLRPDGKPPSTEGAGTDSYDIAGTGASIFFPPVRKRVPTLPAAPATPQAPVRTTEPPIDNLERLLPLLPNPGNSIESYYALKSLVDRNGPMGPHSIHAGNKDYLVTGAAVDQALQGFRQLSKDRLLERLSGLQRSIAETDRDLQAALTTHSNFVSKWWYRNRIALLDPHVLDRPRAHAASAQGTLEREDFRNAKASIAAGEELVNYANEAIHQFHTGIDRVEEDEG